MADNKLKITIDQLKNYLGTGLKVSLENYPLGYHERTFEMDCGHDFQMYLQNGWVRPICYRLSDLDKFIPELGFVPIEQLLRMSYTAWFAKNEGTRYSEVEKEQTPNYIRANVTYMATFSIEIYKPNIDNEKWWIVHQLFQWHFWPFGEEYFEQGLVIDKLKEVGNG